MTQRKIIKKPVYLIDGARTPFIKASGKPGPFAASDLALYASRPVFSRQSISVDDIDEVILGCVMPGPDEANIARVVALRLGCSETVPAWTVQRNCASGMQALDSAVSNIALGRSDLILAGGVEAMSHAPVLLNTKMVAWLGAWMRSRSIGQRLKTLLKLRPAMFAPVIGLLRGLTDPVVGLNMGQTAEELAYRFSINRETMDDFAMRSHQRLADAQDNAHLDEIESLFDTRGNVYAHDDGVRRDTTTEKLAKLKPAFDRLFGSVTAGNSAQITDGAAMLMLASEQAVEKHQLTPIARIVDSQWAGLDPSQMGLGPVHAMTPILKRQKLKLDDVDVWEINEAFAAQVLACLEAWKSASYCREHLHSRSAMGELDQEKLNIDGGGISIGHPVGASGARIVLHAANIMKRQNSQYAMASLCIGGGQGGAMLLTNT